MACTIPMASRPQQAACVTCVIKDRGIGDRASQHEPSQLLKVFPLYTLLVGIISWNVPALLGPVESSWL
eukprot:2498605-Amphidinium_carterae.1